MRSKAYRAMDVNRVVPELCVQGHDSPEVHAGLDIGKDFIFCSVRWRAGEYERPWRARNPADVVRLAEVLRVIAQQRRLVVAMEPTGTYGDPLRQALARAGLEARGVSPKQASDYAEVFDGVPSQHDGKDAAIVAELAAQGRSWQWLLAVPSEAEQELAYQVDWMDAQRRQMVQWCGRVEALLSRHWPEATGIVGLTSGTLLRCLATYGGPGGLAAASDAAQRLQEWGGSFLAAEKVETLVASARQTVGVVMGRWDEERLRRYAQEIRDCRKALGAARRRLHELTGTHTIIRAMGEVVGIPTACVLWVGLGDPRGYHCGGAYRKAMGLNLAERSSGHWQGKLKISKRGPSEVRRWLYLAALRWVRQEPVRSWYARQKAARRGEGKAAVIGIMRKLALAVYRVGGRADKFDRQALYRSLTSGATV